MEGRHQRGGECREAAEDSIWRREEVSIGRRQGDEYLVARREQEEVAMGPSGRNKALPID